MSNEENARRILENVKTLLIVGQFPGEVAPVLAEAQQLLSSMTKMTEGEAPSEQEATV